MNCYLMAKRIKEGGGTRRVCPQTEVPSVTLQTEWPCQSFDFSRSNFPLGNGAGDYFNCSCAQRGGREWLIVRRAKWTVGASPWGVNDLLAFELEGHRPVGGVKVQIKSLVPGEHFEDPRVFVHEGRTYLSCCNFVWNHPRGRPHQIICEVDGDWKSLWRADPVYGENGSHTLNNRGWEKNWLWFISDGAFHLIYRTQPHTVARFDRAWGLKDQWITRSPKLAWKWGEMRGGTPPVLIGDEYWSWFHSSSDWGVKRYHMAPYAFEAKAPHRMTRCADRPFLSGSAQDKTGQGKPLCVFPCGSIFRGGEWFITFGINDLEAGWIGGISQQEVLERVVSL